MAIVVAPGQAVGQPDWDALSAQHGGVKSTSKLAATEAQMKDAGLAQDDDPAFQQRPIYRYYFNDGTYVDARTAANYADFQVIDYKPSSQFTQNPANRPAAAAKPTNVYIGTNPATGKPTQVSEYPDGHKEYDDTQVPAAQAPQRRTRTETQGTQRPDGTWDNEQPREVVIDADTGQVISSKPLAGQALQDWRDARERTRNGGKTDAEIQAEKDKNKPGAPTLRPDGKGGTIAVQPMPDGTIKTTPLPDVPSEAVSKYAEVRQDPATGAWTGLTKDGKWEPIQGGPGTGAPRGTAGPSMPQIVLGSSQEALRTYKDQLQQGVSSGLWSQKWADERWAEALQVANMAVQEAATAQRERESTRAAEINLAQGRATLGQNAMTTALDHVNKINGLLPEGSNLGGQTFAALMGLSMLMQARSGVDSIDPRGRPSTLPQITPAQLRDPAAVSQVRAQVNQQVQQAAAPAPAPAPSTPAVARPSGGGSAEPPARAAIPSAAPSANMGGAAMLTPSVVQATTGTTHGLIDNLTQAADGNERPDDVLTLRSPDGTINQVTRAQYEAAPPETRAAYQVVNAEGAAAATSRQVGGAVSAEPAGLAPSDGQPRPYASPIPSDMPPSYAKPDTYAPQPDPQMPVNVPYPTNDATQSYAPPRSEYAVMAKYQPMQFGQPPQQAQQQAAPMPEPLAVTRSRAAMTEPWRVPTSDLQAWLDAGVPEDEIWGVKRMGNVA